MWVYGCLLSFTVLLKIVSGSSELPGLLTNPQPAGGKPWAVKPSPYPWKPETRSCPASRSCTAPSATRTGSPTPAPRNGRPRRQTSQGPETTQQAQLGPTGRHHGPSAARSQGCQRLWPPGPGSKRSGLEWERPRGPAVGFHQGPL